ncbi:OmpA family protein [Mesobacterium pallidum]|uniref:OmpA family protein n=1 Tax=Mesobacterium pallidum TaxID=2872037 RepID=UPI001EE33D4D|nr:OmpA family protein [Mesobacterium pallidum]
MTNTTVRSANLAALLALLAGPAMALTLDLPVGARLVEEQAEPRASYALPIAPWTGETVPALLVEGAVTRQAWRIETPGLTNLQVLAPIREQLLTDGYDLLLDCAATICGGFDFRFGTEVLPEPAMHVDLADFHFISAVREGEAGADHVSLLASHNLSASFLQVVQVGQGDEEITRGAVIVSSGPQGPLSEELEARGHVVLSDLTFRTGSSELGEGPFATLAALGQYLVANPGRQVALVGHTDSVGALESNIALSRRRAASVADRLVREFGVPREQISAEGMGYLSPVASNLTPEGREANRRVEAVLISTE